MFRIIARVISSPGAFFTELREDESLARWGLPIVLLVTLASSLATYALLLPQRDAFPGTQIGEVTVQLRVFGTALVFFTGWLVFGLVVRMAAGMEARPWAVAAYATIPVLLFSIVIAATALAVPPEVTPATDIPDDQALQEELTRIERETQESLAGTVNSLLSLVGVAWYMALIYLGVRGTTGNPGKALRATSFVAIAYLLALILPPLLFGL